LLATGATAVEVLSIGEALARAPRGTFALDGADDARVEIAASCVRIRAGASSTESAFGVEQREALVRACDAYAGATPENEASLRADVTRAGDDLSGAYASEPTMLVMTLTLLMFGSLLAALGIGSVGAVLAIVGTVAGLANPSLAAPVVGLGVTTFLIALAAAPWGTSDLARRPRDATSALIVASSLVPVATLSVLVAGWSDDEGGGRRLASTAIVALGGWVAAGGPTLALAGRADRLVHEHPQVGGRARIALARLAVAAFGIVTAIALGHALWSS